jgi:SAM-dependent methyltransferase
LTPVPDRELGATFRHAGVAQAYRHRPPYPAEVFDVLEELAGPPPRAVLDLGAGDGSLARPLAARVDRVDAVEVSAAMVAAGRRRPGGDRANLRWLVEPAETTTAPGPYTLVTAGASLHWMEPRATLGRVARLLTATGVLAVVDQAYHALPWRHALREVIRRHSRSPGYDPDYDLPTELQHRGLFTVDGRHTTAPVRLRRSVDGYVEQFHSTASLARELMPPAEAVRFADEVRAVVREHTTAAGDLVLAVTATVVWGRPAVTGPP